MAGPTLEDVARDAGVSLATASRVLNGSARRVADAYRERVIEAARRLDYSPNASAQAVARGESNSVILVIPDISDPFFSAIAAGVANEAERLGLVVVIAVTERDQEKEARAVRSLRDHRPRAFILAGSRFIDPSNELERELVAHAARGGQVVMFGDGPGTYPVVELGNRAGAHDLGHQLAGRGYRRVAVLGGRRDVVSARDRVRGFREGMRGAGVDVPEPNVRWGPFTREGAREVVAGMSDADLAGIDLIFAVSDVMALGAMSALRERGYDVPGQIAVAGFDDIDVARDVSPALSTVRLPLEDLGRRAVLLASRHDPGEAPASPQVVLRASTPIR